MIKGNRKDKDLARDILLPAFYDNQSVNYIVKQDNRKRKRIGALIDYSFDICMEFGEAFFSDDKTACALVFYPDKKKANLKTNLWDIQLILRCVGVGGVGRAIEREKKIKSAYPDPKEMYYLWFIGVKPEQQGKGRGSHLLRHITEEAFKKNRRVFLETSTRRNLPWYERHGFEIYHEHEFSYNLYFLKN